MGVFMSDKHKHNWELIKWDEYPTDIDDYKVHYYFNLEFKCSCGKKKIRPATPQEVSDYIEKNTCPFCKKIISHSKEECFQSLFIRVNELENAFDKLSLYIDDLKSVLKLGK